MAYFRKALLACLAIAGGAALSENAHSADPVKVVVLREHGSGSPARAQPFLDKLLRATAKQAGWSSATGRYVTRREQALTFIEEEKPDFGIFSLPAFLALRAKHGLEVVGEVRAASTGGQRYFIVSKNAQKLEECKGKPLASDHLDDPRFIEAVVARGQFRLKDFELMKTRRPVQTLKKVIRDKAACALVDDAQLDAAKSIKGGSALKAVYTSDKLPGMAVVAFKSTPAARVQEFKTAMPKLCSGSGASACKSVGIRSLHPANKKTYANVIAAYSK